MTLTVSPPITPAGVIERPVSILPLPGLTERALVVLTTFVFLHQIPNAWFRGRAVAETDASNPLLVLVTLFLIVLAFLRVAGSIDHLITMFKLETGVYVFAGMTFATIFWSADPGASMRRSIVFVAVTLYASYLVLRFSLDQIIRLLAVMFVVSAAINLMFIVALPLYGTDLDGRFTGVFNQKNALGYTAALGIPALIVAGRAWRPGRLIFYPTVVIHIGLLIGSESKTMLLAAAGPVALMGVYQLFRGRKTLRGAVLLSLAGSSIFTIAFATANVGLLAKWLDKDVTLTGRVPLWENLIPIALDRPLFGHGYGATFNGYFSPVHEVWIQNRWNPSHAHNALLQIWLEMGVVAAVLFLVVYVRAVTRAIKIVAIVPGAVGLWPLVFLTTTLLVSITESGVSADQIGWMMFVVAVLSASLHLRHRRNLGMSNDVAHGTDQLP